MTAFTFEIVENALPTPGLALQINQDPPKYWRVTHVFGDTVFVIAVTHPQAARDAKRPMPKEAALLMSLYQKGAEWGRLSMPDELSSLPLPDSDKAAALEAAWNVIEPLVGAMEHTANLDRSNFIRLIQARAEATSCTVTTVRRLLLRYYYFGQSKNGLLLIPRGQRPSNSGTAEARNTPTKRRGRSSVLEDKFGANEFVVGDDDIGDMVNVFQTRLKAGRTLTTEAHELYLATAFADRHPKVYADYINNMRELPLSLRQFRYYVKKHAVIDQELAENLRTRKSRIGFVGSETPGPGQFEIDATGGRLYLVSSGDKLVVLRKPTIYLMIDRWSRFIVSVYISVNPPSFEEVRQALLIAFTSREARFRNLGINVSDTAWPIGRMPWALVTDRGSEFMGEAFERAVVSDLRIELVPLPPATPDGKAVVERMIKTLKQRMHSSGLKGTYAERISDHDTEQAAKKAERAAIHTLAEAYRVLIDIVIDHNNRPHETLKRYKELAHAGIAPTPSAAYEWGRKNITGLRFAAQTDEFYRRQLLSYDKATISNGAMRYRNRFYAPSNEAAERLVNNSRKRAHSVDIRLDKNAPFELSVIDIRGSCATFAIAPGSMKELEGTTLDEIDVFAKTTALMNAEAESESLRDRLIKKSSSSKRPQLFGKKSEIQRVGKREMNSISDSETARLKSHLTGTKNASTSPKPTNAVKSPAAWETIEDQQNRNDADLISKLWGNS